MENTVPVSLCKKPKVSIKGTNIPAPVAQGPKHAQAIGLEEPWYDSGFSS